MADIKKFLDQSGVSTLWTKIAAELKAEQERAQAAEEAAAAAAQDAQADVDALETYVGTIPEGYTETNVVAYINKKAEETLSAAQGGSSETAASVKAALDDYIEENDEKVQANTDAIDAIEADYLKAADKTELSNAIGANTTEIARVNSVLVNALENEGAGLDSIKELATWIEEHGEDAAGYAEAITALEGKVGEKTVATQISEAIAAENLSQYATVTALNTEKGRIDGLVEKVDTGNQKVSEYVAAAVAALNIADYAKAADLLALAGRVTTAEGKITTLEGNDANKETRIAAMEAKVTKWDAAESNAKAHADGLNTAMDARVQVLEGHNHSTYELKTDASAKLTEAKTYTDTEVAKIQALTTAEIESAIAGASV